jgi:hypothetical protein
LPGSFFDVSPLNIDAMLLEEPASSCDVPGIIEMFRNTTDSENGARRHVEGLQATSSTKSQRSGRTLAQTACRVLTSVMLVMGLLFPFGVADGLAEQTNLAERYCQKPVFNILPS